MELEDVVDFHDLDMEESTGDSSRYRYRPPFEEKKKKRKLIWPLAKRFFKASFPFTHINVFLVLIIFLLPLACVFLLFLFGFPDTKVLNVEVWKWATWIAMMVVAWVGFYVIAGFLVLAADNILPRTQFTYYFIVLDHTIAMTGVGVIGYLSTEFYLEDVDHQEFILRAWASVIAIALLYGVRKILERYTLVLFARKEYFTSLKKLMFQEKIVFKLLESKLKSEREKLSKRKKKEKQEVRLTETTQNGGDFDWIAPEEITPGNTNEFGLSVHADVKLIDDDSVAHPKIKWVSPTEKEEPPDIFMIHQCEKYSENRKFSFLNYGKDRKRLYHLSNEVVRQQLLDEDIDAVTELIFKALGGHHQPITVDSFAIIFPNKPHRCQAAFALFSGGPLDTILLKRDIRATVARVFRSRHNASASLQGRGDIAKVLSGFVGVFFWSLMIVVVLLIYRVDLVQVAVPYFLVVVAFSLMFGTSIYVIVQSAVFILVLHPFDVGDRISIDGGETIIVKTFTLAQTVGYKPDGRWVSLPNSRLFNAKIQNYHRSKSYTIDVKFEISANIDRSAIEQVIDDTYELCADHPIYLPDPEVLVSDIEHGNALKIGFWVPTRAVPWYDIDTNVMIKTNFCLWVADLFKKKGIEFREPVLPVNVSKSPH